MAEMAEITQKQRHQFVLFGSSFVHDSYSTLQGWGATLSHCYARKSDIGLRGYGGWNSRRALGILDQVFPKDLVVQPSLVIVHFGNEDSTRPHSSGKGPHVPLQEYLDNMKNIALHLKSLRGTNLIFLSNTPVNEAKIPEDSDGKKARTNELSEQYKDALKKLCSEMGILFLDLFSAIQKTENWQDVCFLDDGVSLSAAGHKVVYLEILLSALKKTHDEWGLYWLRMPSEFGEDSPYDPVADDGQTTLNASMFVFPNHDLWGEPFHLQSAITNRYLRLLQ